MGIVLDADEHLDRRWQSISHTLQASGYGAIPAEPTQDGTIVEQPGKVRFGAWIMPDNKLPGILEDFVGYLVPPDDRLWDQARLCVESAASLDRRFPAQSRSKAIIHTWLAWQEEPGSPLGSAITKRYLDAESSFAARFVDWLRRLYELV